MSYWDDLLAHAPQVLLKLNDAAASPSAADSSGNARTMTASGTPIFEQPSIIPSLPDDTCVLLDGINEWFSRAVEPWMHADTFSVVFVIRPTNLSRARSEVFGKVEQNQLWLVSGGQGSCFMAVPTPWTNYLTAGGVFAVDSTYHCVWVRRTSEAPGFRLYVNGIVAASGPNINATRDTVHELRFGSSSTSPTNFAFAGYMQGAAWINAELSAAQVAGLYASFLESNAPPATPTLGVEGITATSATLTGTPYSDPEGDAHVASQWQVQAAGGDWSAPIVDSGEDPVNLLSFPTGDVLPPSTDFEARGRYRDATGWGEYSAVAPFTTLSGASWVACAAPPETEWAPCAVPTPEPGGGSAWSAAVIAGDPSLYWRVQETQGVTAADSSGNARPGTYVGDVDLAESGLFPGSLRAVELNNGAYIERAWEAWMDVRTHFKMFVEGWFQVADTSRHYLFAMPGAFEVYVENQRLALLWNGNSLHEPVDVVPVGSPFYVAFAQNDNIRQLYLNCVSLFSAIGGFAAFNPSLPFYVGRGSGVPSGTLLVDEVAVYVDAAAVAATSAVITRCPLQFDEEGASTWSPCGTTPAGSWEQCNG